LSDNDRSPQNPAGCFIEGMKTWFITGSDTGVGKTVLTSLLTRHLRASGVRVRAVKPFCSGGRDDAEALFAAQDGAIPLVEVSPWHFRAPLAPLVAARRERRRVTLAEAVEFIRRSARQCDVLLVEGAGGVLSPLGEGFSARELIAATQARPLIVCANRLGAINQALMALGALPRPAAKTAQLILSQAGGRDSSQATNVRILGELAGAGRVHALPRLTPVELARLNSDALPPRLRRKLAALIVG
jgi:dethiobiotin synthetase